MLPKDFAVFILTHGRADKVVTYQSLRNCGYTGPIYLLVDNEDKQQAEYIRKYGKEVIIFDKLKAAGITDAADNFQKRNSVVYARNWNFVIAKEMGLRYFWQLDDDYSAFGYTADNEHEYLTRDTSTKQLDQWLAALIEFAETAQTHSIALSQGGDFIGGEAGNFFKKVQTGQFSRKVMNSFLLSTERPIKFKGRMNDDVNMYVDYGHRGYLFITIPRLRITQKATQANAGGLTDMYLEFGTYAKSFYSIMYRPSCVKIAIMGTTFKRIHHHIKWRNAVPLILHPKTAKTQQRAKITQGHARATTMSENVHV